MSTERDPAYIDEQSGYLGITDGTDDNDSGGLEGNDETLATYCIYDSAETGDEESLYEEW